MAKNVDFGPNLVVFGPKILIFMGVSKSFGTHIMEKPPRQLVRIDFWSGNRSNGTKCRYLSKNASFGPNLAVFGPKNPKKITASELGVIFWGSLLFLAVLGLCHFTIISTPNFGSFSTKLSGTVRVIKKKTQNDDGPRPGRNYGETAVFTFS